MVPLTKSPGSSLQRVYHRACCQGVSKVLPETGDSLCSVSGNTELDRPLHMRNGVRAS